MCAVHDFSRFGVCMCMQQAQSLARLPRTFGLAYARARAAVLLLPGFHLARFQYALDVPGDNRPPARAGAWLLLSAVLVALGINRPPVRAGDRLLPCVAALSLLVVLLLPLLLSLLLLAGVCLGLLPLRRMAPPDRGRSPEACLHIYIYICGRNNRGK